MLSDYISKQERVACMKVGALAYAGMMDADFGPLPREERQVKQADGGLLPGSVDAAKTLYVLAAAGAGIPIGIFSHVMGRRIAGKRLREEELKEKIRLYQMAADEMAAGLSGGGA